MVKFIFNAFGISINFICIILLILSGISTEFNPNNAPFFSILGLGFIPLVIINILFVLFWIIKFSWYFIFSLFAIIFLSGNIHNTFPIHIFSTENKIEAKSELKILTYNVKLFDFYKKKNNGHSVILDSILAQDADIVCLQEYGTYEKKGYLTDADIKNILGKKYPYQIFNCLTTKKKSTYGIATFSKFPILNHKSMNTESDYSQFGYADIKLEEDTIRLFNCHLESNQFTNNDKRRIVEMASEGDKEDFTETTDLFARKFTKASKTRATQANIIATEIKKSPYGTIVCGDFNDSPISYTYKKIKGILKDAFIENSFGYGNTYNEFPFLFRIDYILYSSNFEASNFEIRNKQKLSDHYPISVTLKIKK